VLQASTGGRDGGVFAERRALRLISIETSGLARLLTTARQEAIFLIMTHID
jgi:hypothetical protein